MAELRKCTVLVALDGDLAGRKGAVRAYDQLLPYTSMPAAVVLPGGADPAGILQARGAGALRAALQDAEPLAKVVIDTFLDSGPWQLDHPEEQLHAMRSAVSVIAGTLPPAATSKIRQLTLGPSAATPDQDPQTVSSPDLPAIARALPHDAICQIVQVAERTASDNSDVIADLVNALRQDTKSSKDPTRYGESTNIAPASGTVKPLWLVAASFPRLPTAADPAVARPLAARPTLDAHSKARAHHLLGITRRACNGTGWLVRWYILAAAGSALLPRPSTASAYERDQDKDGNGSKRRCEQH